MILSNSAIDTICMDVKNSNQFYWASSKNFFSDLYMTGCRSKELLDINRWKDLGDTVELTTFKTEAKRIFTKSMLSDEFLEALKHNIWPYKWLTYDQFTLEFRKVVNAHPIYAGKKKVDTYLFRYNRARKAFDETNDIMQVMDFFGWKSVEIARNYIVQPLQMLPTAAGYL